jgi:hypothetical protein
MRFIAKQGKPGVAQGRHLPRRGDPIPKLQRHQNQKKGRMPQWATEEAPGSQDAKMSNNEEALGSAGGGRDTISHVDLA